eukprot:CAMPEP_0185189370 /NCGR_PEP_ID=MMETSP1140-20130426/5989_1 /TAXON_ID=298111 /ORGANISM="Pavlova sp., Strain CCMP459" /LENGTH=164 /DNA_ID=CAMNT_0027755925 /DNA_START=355 /DNA_END=845 /DNA_ORIENTATION=+
MARHNTVAHWPAMLRALLSLARSRAQAPWLRWPPSAKASGSFAEHGNDGWLLHFHPLSLVHVADALLIGSCAELSSGIACVLHESKAYADTHRSGASYAHAKDDLALERCLGVTEKRDADVCERGREYGPDVEPLPLAYAREWLCTIHMDENDAERLTKVARFR